MNIRLVACLLAFTRLPMAATRAGLPAANAVFDRFRPASPDQQKFAGLFALRMRANSEGFLEHLEEKIPLQAGPDNSGAFLEAAVIGYEYNHDSQLKTVIDRLAKRLAATSANYSGKTAWSTDDLWNLRATILGLSAYSRAMHERDIYDLLAKLGNTLLSAAQSNLSKQILIEPSACLYRYTGDERYLSLARALAKPMLQAQPTPASAPAYENLVGLEGLVELYHLTGDGSYIRAASGAWAALHSSGISITGAPLLNGQPAGACETAAWMQLTLSLLKIGGDAQYGNELERTIYNQLFAGQDLNSGAIFAAPPLNGEKSMANSDNRCLANQALGIALIPSGVWGRFGRGIQVNLYGVGRGAIPLHRHATVQLYSEGSFPESGDILLHVEPSRPLQFPLRLRVPEWATTFSVDIGGSHILGKPDTFLTLNRKWNRGDTVRISMDMSVHVLTNGSSESGEVALQRGPQLLALGSKYNPELGNLSAAALYIGERSPMLHPVDKSDSFAWLGDQAYTLPGKYDGKARQLVLTPFADTLTYRIWIKSARADSGLSE